MNEKFETMSIQEAVDYCYQLKSNGKCEFTEREFECLIFLLKDETIKPKDLPNYGIV